MGVVLAKFRKEKTTTEVLEKLEERIQQIEKYSFSTQEQKKRFVGNFLTISIGLYVIAFLAFYFLYFPPTWLERFFYSVPLLIFPVFIIFVRKGVSWYFQRKLNKNSKQLNALRNEKKKILERVMDKETYKVAVGLLNRFGDKTNGTKSMTALTPRAPYATPGRPNQSMRRLTSISSNQSNIPSQNLNTTLTPQVGQQPNTPPHAYGNTDLSRQVAFPSVGNGLIRRTPFPVVNEQNKTVFERIVDILIGDGPSDRFAMICKECFGHNGMAVIEEFDFATFRCAFCNALNPSRKARPIAPALPLQISGTHGGLFSKDSSDSSSESSDAYSENENVRIVPSIKMTEVSSPEIEAYKTEAEETEVDETEAEKTDAQKTEADKTDADKIEDEKSEAEKEHPKETEQETKKDI